jgi:hypothetical protein
LDSQIHDILFVEKVLMEGPASCWSFYFVKGEDENIFAARKGGLALPITIGMARAFAVPKAFGKKVTGNWIHWGSV